MPKYDLSSPEVFENLAAEVQQMPVNIDWPTKAVDCKGQIELRDCWCKGSSLLLSHSSAYICILQKKIQTILLIVLSFSYVVKWQETCLIVEVP